MDIIFKVMGILDHLLLQGNHRMALKGILFIHLPPVPLVIRRLPGAENPPSHCAPVMVVAQMKLGRRGSGI